MLDLLLLKAFFCTIGCLVINITYTVNFRVVNFFILILHIIYTDFMGIIIIGAITTIFAHFFGGIRSFKLCVFI